MKKLDNFSNCFNVLKNADWTIAEQNEIYKTGVISQFNLTFELAWKALQEIMRLHGITSVETGSPREILKLGYKFGFIDDEQCWLLMLRKRNTTIYIYDENEINDMLTLIRESFIGAFDRMEQILLAKLEEVELS